MLFYGLIGLVLSGAGEGNYKESARSPLSLEKSGSFQLVKAYKKKKKSLKSRKRKSSRKKPKRKIYSAKAIEKLLQNQGKEGKCTRLNCASDLKIAQSCLPDRASHRKHKKCFRAFCAYGCNEADYKSKADVYDFCNAICSSKKYLKKKIPRPD